MKHQPFPLPQALDGGLSGVFAYWRDLKRGQADIPFTDDVKLSALSDPAGAMLVDVLANTARFRFAIVGDAIRAAFGSDLAGLFVEDLRPHAPLDFFLSQCSATMEARAPTYHRGGSYARLLLPLWGEGRINALLGGVSQAQR